MIKKTVVCDRCHEAEAKETENDDLERGKTCSAN